MAIKVKPIRTEADYEAALAEIEAMWGAKSGTPRGDRLDVLATLIDAHEALHYPMDPPDPVEARRQSRLMASSPHATEDQAFVDAISDVKLK